MNISKGENIKVNGIVVLLYGEPGIGKTSTALNTANPIIFDFDNGVQRTEFRINKSVVRLNSWKEIDEDLKNLDSILRNYDNIVIDTIDNCLKYLRIFIEDNDQKMKRNQLQMYGKLKDTFDMFLDRIKKLGKNVILIAHSDLKEIDGKNKTVPKITGGSFGIAKECADFIGYMDTDNNIRSIDFNATDFHIGKNSANFPKLQIPSFHDEPEWFETKLNEMKKALTMESESQMNAIELLKLHNEVINSIDNIKDLENYQLNEVSNLSKQFQIQINSKIDKKKLDLQIESYKTTIELYDKCSQFNYLIKELAKVDGYVKKEVWVYMQEKAKELNFIFNPKSIKFESESDKLPFEG